MAAKKSSQENKKMTNNSTDLIAARRHKKAQNAHLGSKEREFLSLVSQAAFANPFGDDRTRLDLEISGLPDSVPPRERLQAMLDRVRNFLVKLDEAEKSRINAFSESDRLLLEKAHLFDAFHRFIDDFDQLIQKQIKTGDASCPVHFADKVFNFLMKGGFSEPDACRYFAMFYLGETGTGKGAAATAIGRSGYIPFDENR